MVGGVVGAPAQNQIEDAPAYATAGYRKPQMAQAGCVQSSVRLPRELLGYISGPITVKFAINRDGSPSRYEVMTAVPDKRISDAIWNAIQGCKCIRLARIARIDSDEGCVVCGHLWFDSLRSDEMPVKRIE